MADDEDEEEILYQYEGPRAAGEEVTLTVTTEEEKVRTKQFTLLGAREGEGKATYPNGDTYTGEYVGGKREGQGTYVYAEKGWRYTGGFRAGLRHGLGEMQYGKGVRYHGHWAGGKRSGQGTMYYANKDIYTGEWQDGSKHGSGTYYFAETGGEVEGTWEGGLFVTGTWTDKAGLKYTGRFENQLPSSDGEFSFGGGLVAKGYYTQTKAADGTVTLQWVQSDLISPSD